MEKRTKSYEENLKPSILYLDDLEKIIEILKDVSGEIEIYTSEYKLNNFDEIKEIHEELLEFLEIIIEKPWIHLCISPAQTTLYAQEDTAISRGVIDKIKQILKARKRKFYWLSGENISTLILTLLFGLCVGFLYFGISKRILFLILIGVLFLIIEIVYFRVGVIKGIGNIIYLEKRIEKKSFWKRKKDDIILAVISALIGSIITVVMLKIFQLF